MEVNSNDLVFLPASSSRFKSRYVVSPVAILKFDGLRTGSETKLSLN